MQSSHAIPCYSRGPLVSSNQSGRCIVTWTFLFCASRACIQTVKTSPPEDAVRCIGLGVSHIVDAFREKSGE